MNYIDTETNVWPLTEYQIKQANPQVSFPEPFKSERYKPIVDMPQPSFDAITQRVEQVMPVNKGTHWEQAWSVVTLDAGTVAAKYVAMKAAFILQVDADTDALIAAVIGNRGSEYELAEAEATAFAAAGYAGTAPQSVKSWADAKAWNAKQAADDILVAAAGWRAAQKALRANRLLAKESAKAADGAALDTVKAQWTGFLGALKAQLGVS